MNRIIIIIVLVAVLAMTLSACSSASDIPVSDGDVAACLAFKGQDVQSWTFTSVEKMANNVCYVYQQQQ